MNPQPRGVIPLLALLLFTHVLVSAQAYSPIEVGVQGSGLTLFDPISYRDEQGGFGARATYNGSPVFAVDAEADFFPTSTRLGPQRGGRTFLLLAGPKSTWRRRNINIFAEARPGIANFSNIVRAVPANCNGTPCISLIPGGHVTHFALSLGGGVEFNTSRRTFVRLGASETLFRYGDRVARFGNGLAAFQGVVGNSLLVTAGLSYRVGPLSDRTIAPEGALRWEIGAQYGLLSLGRARLVHAGSLGFVPLFLGDDRGFGGRFTYNVNRWLALDSAVNYFYTNSFEQDAQRGGKMLQGLFGPKAGFRTRRYGLFAKARPGFLSYGSVHDNNFPPFPTHRLTYFNFDVGGVIEYYPSRRTLVRFDLGHTAVFYGPHAVPSPPGPPFFGTFVERAFQDKGMQLMAGWGWRF